MSTPKTSWVIGRRRPGAVGRPAVSRPADPVPLPVVVRRRTVWIIGAKNTDIYGQRTRGVPHGSWHLYKGRIFHKKRIYRKQTSPESALDLRSESDPYREFLLDDREALMDLFANNPQLFKAIFPHLYPELAAQDPGDSIENNLDDPESIMESMDPSELKERYPALWKKRYGKKQIESDAYWDNKKEIDANSR